MTAVCTEAERQLAAVRCDFQSQLCDMFKEIAGAWNDGQAAADPAALGRVVELLHRLAGNAGFFGLAEVSRTASLLEQAIDLRSDDEMPREASVAEPRRLMQLLLALRA